MWSERQIKAAAGFTGLKLIAIEHEVVERGGFKSLVSNTLKRKPLERYGVGLSDHAATLISRVMVNPVVYLFLKRNGFLLAQRMFGNRKVGYFVRG